MNRLQNLDRALQLLLAETVEQAPIPDTLADKQRLLRALMNVRQPAPPSDELLTAQDKELQQQRDEKGVLAFVEPGLHLWQGDITRLQVDAIVNAANSQLLGCFVPLHACIDNAIHSAAGIQLRCACHDLMRMQGHDEPTGRARITPGFNLPARYVLHTVGPIIPDGRPTPEQVAQLASCYRACLDLAEEHALRSVAFCCISTGVFRFPQRLAAETAIRTVRQYPRQHVQTIVFNVFTDTDYALYHSLL